MPKPKFDLLVVSDEDIQHSAAGMIRMHRSHAAGECEAIMEKMRRRGDREGTEVWRRILLAVRAAPQSVGESGANRGAFSSEDRSPVTHSELKREPVRSFTVPHKAIS